MFRILTEQEVSKLDAEKLKTYEKALHLYKQRVAIIDKLEQIDNVGIEPFYPKIEAIELKLAPSETVKSVEKSSSDFASSVKPEIPVALSGTITPVEKTTAFIMHSAAKGSKPVIPSGSVSSIDNNVTARITANIKKIQGEKVIAPNTTVKKVTKEAADIVSGIKPEIKVVLSGTITPVEKTTAFIMRNTVKSVRPAAPSVLIRTIAKKSVNHISNDVPDFPKVKINSDIKKASEMVFAIKKPDCVSPPNSYTISFSDGILTELRGMQ